MKSELSKLIDEIESGTFERPPELMKLAEQAVIAQAKVQEQIARGEFDIEAWARRLAEDVAHFTD